ncbi:MAG: hypothetical protein A3B15_03370 [Candidatus Buchananbacteria bacterium RIFCSPLOWO2_01_FULL_45_31]|uniref:PEP-utilising enzyme mobile domain-containing protein n=1 Tax=Candidatus Buchananbacteria bacterium RIFCSPLOWO2_01_FULL_45_31 TaxID=1797545 RepID=A0A1G1YP45_9BACT|nr:MAG: hypothetical protein A3B15_03370 [Candidatus Buchananbacteria bacterium RIFCSPLOWO2_01_FULL_45_31]
MKESEIKKIKWTKWLKRPYTPFLSSLCFSGVGKKYYRKVELGNFDYNFLFQDDTMYYDENKMEKNRRQIVAFLRKKDIFKIVKMLNSQHKKNIQKIKALIKGRQKPTAKLKILKEITSQYLPFLWITPMLEYFYDLRIERDIKPLIKENVADFIANSGPIKKTQSEIMADDIRKGLPASLILKKYGWMKSRDGFTDFYTIKEINDIIRHVKNNKRITASKYRILPKKIFRLCRELREAIFFRTDRTDKFYEALAVSRPIYQEIADSLGISFKALADYDANSIIFGQPKKYQDNYYYLLLNGKEFINQGELIKINKILDYHEVKGIIVQKGKAIGRVKIVSHSSQISKVNQGDILVTPMTLPSFILGMNKAAAFVTDEGSLTCHAAIVAREMKKPCITGTKIATQVFKDGDLVEVDANQGIVKKLKNTKISN